MFNLFSYQNISTGSEISKDTFPEVTTSVGAKEIHNIELNAIKHCGPLKVSGSKVLNSMEVVGPVEIEYSNIANLSIAGLSKINNSKLYGDFFKVAGYVSIMHSQVECKMILGSNKIDIGSSTLKGIEVNNTGLNEQPEVLTLNNSIVDGDIVFTSGKGEVKSYDSKCTGKVIGGVMNEYSDNLTPKF